MSYLYNIFFATVVGTSLFAMDRKNDNSDAFKPKAPIVYRMQPKLSCSEDTLDTEKRTTTYKYHDGSKSTYYEYNDSSPHKKK